LLAALKKFWLENVKVRFRAEQYNIANV